MDPWIGWIVGERIEATTLVPPPLMKRSAPNDGVAKNNSFGHPPALVVVGLSPLFFICTVATKGGFGWICGFKGLSLSICPIYSFRSLSGFLGAESSKYLKNGLRLRKNIFITHFIRSNTFKTHIHQYNNNVRNIFIQTMVGIGSTHVRVQSVTIMLQLSIIFFSYVCFEPNILLFGGILGRNPSRIHPRACAKS